MADLQESARSLAMAGVLNAEEFDVIRERIEALGQLPAPPAPPVSGRYSSPPEKSSKAPRFVIGGVLALLVFGIAGAVVTNSHETFAVEVHHTVLGSPCGDTGEVVTASREDGTLAGSTKLEIDPVSTDSYCVSFGTLNVEDDADAYMVQIDTREPRKMTKPLLKEGIDWIAGKCESFSIDMPQYTRCAAFVIAGQPRSG